MGTVAETRIVEEIPDSMKRLASFIARGFYSKDHGKSYSCDDWNSPHCSGVRVFGRITHGIVMDMLKRFVCMKEDSLKELSKIDIKQLRTILITLKQDKLIKERQLVEERSESNRPIKINYYFINYRALLNVTKYKLEHMRRKLESEEMTNTTRASYKCSNCSKPYTDLDVGHLWDMDSMRMLCLFCRGTVEEDETAGPSKDTRSLLARFNEQMSPLFLLLQELDGVQLAPHLLEPTPVSDKEADSGASTAGNAFGRAGVFQKSQFNLYQQQGFTVNIEGSESVAPSGQESAPEVPLWLRESTVPVIGAEEDASVGTEFPSSSVQPPSPTKEVGHNEIVETLLAHEKKGEEANRSVEDSVEKEGDFSEDEFEDVEDGDPVVSVQGRKHALSEVCANPVLVDQMTAEEKSDYIRISQQHFDHD